MTEEYIFCPVTGKECEYKQCPAFNVESDDCGMRLLILGLWNENSKREESVKPPQRETKIANPETNIVLELEAYSGDVDISYDLQTVTTKGFLGDRWSPINEIMKNAGYGWVSDGKSSHWRKGYVAPPRDTNIETKQTPKEVEWKRNSKNTGDYTFSDKLPELAKEIQEKGPWYTKDGYTYSLFGDTNELGFPKMIGRKKAKAKSK